MTSAIETRDENDGVAPVPAYRSYPTLRFMGSKHRLLPWLEDVLGDLDCSSAVDAFSGSGCVSYLLKTMGKRVHSNDFLRFAAHFPEAVVVNSDLRVEADDLGLLLSAAPHRSRFIETEFRNIFYGDDDNRFLDQVWHYLPALEQEKRALVLSALYRSCLKRQPRGVFTVAGGGKYDDGRRDLRLSLRDHFLESIQIFNRLVFADGLNHTVTSGDVFRLDPRGYDLVYLDPPYVPRADDNCYIKRYHFLEGLATYWEGADFHPTSKVKKLKKRYTPFSYRRDAEDAFDRMFNLFRDQTIVLSYSSNGFPDIRRLVELLRRYKRDVTVLERSHRYHFGTHSNVARDRVVVAEYLVVGA